MTTYRTKLQDPKWQKKRLEIMQRDDWKCMHCNDKTTMLSVHHKTYFDDREPWEYDDNLLVTLCQPCHDWIHKMEHYYMCQIDEFVPFMFNPLEEFNRWVLDGIDTRWTTKGYSSNSVMRWDRKDLTGPVSIYAHVYLLESENKERIDSIRIYDNPPI